MKIQNAFSTLLTVLITAVVVGVLTGVISYSSAASKKDLEIEDLKEQLSQAKEEASVEPGSMILDTSETNNQQPTTDSQQATTTPSTAADETANWKTYTNDKYGFTFKYPGEWEVLDKTFDNGHIADLLLQIISRPKEMKEDAVYFVTITSSSLSTELNDYRKILQQTGNSEITIDRETKRDGKIGRMITNKNLTSGYSSTTYFFELDKSKTIAISGPGNINDTFRFTK